jgi:carbonic anhydrase
MTPRMTRRRMFHSSAGVALATPVLPLAGFVAGCGDDEASNNTTTAGTKTVARRAPRDGDEALDRLLEGNRRFREGNDENPDRDSVRRLELAESQEPFAVILGCADSRVPPEVIFDEGLGKLFVIRIAGNTAADPFVVGSVEYAVEHLGSILVMVLGHQGCGAVKGAIAEADGAHEPGSIGDFIAPIVPVVEDVRENDPDLSPEELVEPSVQANVKAAVEELSTADNLIAGLVDSGEVKIVGAEYLLETGEVALV